MKKKAFIWIMASVIVFGGLSGCTNAQAEEQKTEVTQQSQPPVLGQGEAPPAPDKKENQGKMVIGKVIEVQEDQFTMESGEMPKANGEKPEGQPPGQPGGDAADGQLSGQPGEIPEHHGKNIPEGDERQANPEGRKQNIDQINWTGEQQTVQIAEGVTIRLRKEDTIMDGTVADLQTGNIVHLLYTRNEDGEEILSSIEVEQIPFGENQQS